MPAPTPFHLRLGPIGIEAAVIDGHDLTDQLAGASLYAGTHDPTVLTLHTLNGGTIEGTGIVQAAPLDDDGQAAVVAFLEGIDPAQLEAEALLDADASRGLTATMLEILVTWARGGPR